MKNWALALAVAFVGFAILIQANNSRFSYCGKLMVMDKSTGRIYYFAPVVEDNVLAKYIHKIPKSLQK